MSNSESWPDPQNDLPAPVTKKGMSGCMLAALITGGLGFVGLLVCCGVGGYFISQFVPKMTQIPAEVTAVGKKILNTEILEGFIPESAMTIDTSIVVMRIAQFNYKEGKGKLMMGMFKLTVGDAGQAKLQPNEIRGKFEDEMRKNLDVKSTESHDITVNGQKVTVSIGEATERESGKAVHTLNAEFNQSNGVTFVILHLDDDVWDQDAVLKMLEDSKPLE